MQEKRKKFKGALVMGQDVQLFAFKVLLFRDMAGDQAMWVAQCLDKDIAAQGKSPRDACMFLIRAIVCNMIIDIKHGVEPLSEFTEAPAEHFERFQRSAPLPTPDTWHGKTPPAELHQMVPVFEDCRIYA